ncbi:hypothetical protein MAPG_06436 [Magnaporthiopsis poae ATCC 64411]|uniref:Uncharacterized protein n=1 Tax=Magnaporthiopsis poae (strain ATCC 64411 / 73-15) TaxID=644358 RepID=A0A0C4E210_MAGP6|nr:hypothetical protein MAPG_06436 [Magnaporthiopsis poae ATCC 64411]
MDSSFTDTEKRFVLGEIIKVSSLDVSTLVDFVRSYNVEPDWLSMQLPGGRNMNQVIRAYETMFQVQAQQPPIPIPHLKRKSIDDLNEPMPKRLAISPVEQQQQQQQQPPPLHAPQPLPPPPAAPFNLPRSIQPRLAPNGYPTLAPIVASPPIVSPAAGAVRKRGRPSKADKEARANASTGYVTVAPMPSQASQPTFQAAPAPPRPTSLPSPPAQNPAAPPPPPPPPPPTAQSPYQAAIGSYGAPKGGAAVAGASGRPQAAGAPVGPEEGNKSGLVRWRPITSPSDYPAMDKRGSRAVSDSTAPRAPPPRETKNVERSERSPSVSNLISAPEPEMDYSTARAAAASRYSPTAAQAAAAGHRIYGGSGGGGGGGGGQSKPAVEHLKHENNGHNLNAHAPVSNPA